jgi:hypothetical protein
MNRLFPSSPSPADSKILDNAGELRIVLRRDWENGQITVSYQVEGGSDARYERHLRRLKARRERRAHRRAAKGLPPRKPLPKTDLSYIRELMERFAEGGGT